MFLARLIFLFATVLIILSACTHVEESQQKVENVSVATPTPSDEIVGLDMIASTVKPSVVIKQVERPQVQSVAGISGAKHRKLLIGPGLLKGQLAILYLKAAREQKIEYAEVAGIEIGSMIALLYAAGVSLEKIEWCFYRFVRESAGLAPYSSRWLEAIEKIFYSQVPQKNLALLERKLLLSRGLGVVSSGEWETVVRDNLDLTNLQKQRRLVDAWHDLYQGIVQSAVGDVEVLNFLDFPLTWQGVDRYGNLAMFENLFQEIEKSLVMARDIYVVKLGTGKIPLNHSDQIGDNMAIIQNVLQAVGHRWKNMSIDTKE